MRQAPDRPRHAPGKRLSFLLAVLVHVALLGLIVYGIHWQTQKPTSVAVELVRVVPTRQPADAVPPAPTSTPEPKPEPKPAPKPEPKPEVKPPPKPDIAVKEKLKPPPKPEPKPQAKPQPRAPQPDPFLDELRREDEQLQRQKATAAAAREVASLKAQQAGTARATALTDYIARIKGKVRGNIILPGDLKGNPEAIFEVTQLPSGEVLGVRLLKSSGHPAWDAATERAILKSSPLPKPAQSELFSRVLELKCRPQEE